MSDQQQQTPVRVLFLCTHNSARSQMAEGLLRQYSGGRVAVFSAGTDPRPVRPEAVAVMQRMGIDISQQQSKHLDTFQSEPFDYVVTVCDQVYEVCPDYPGNPVQLHWGLPDPSSVETSDADRQRAFQQIAHVLVEHVRTLLLLIEQHPRSRPVTP
jgi:protein-tyrosine-phosphatase